MVSYIHELGTTSSVLSPWRYFYVHQALRKSHDVPFHYICFLFQHICLMQPD